MWGNRRHKTYRQLSKWESIKSTKDGKWRPSTMNENKKKFSSYLRKNHLHLCIAEKRILSFAGTARNLFAFEIEYSIPEGCTVSPIEQVWTCLGVPVQKGQGPVWREVSVQSGNQVWGPVQMVRSNESWVMATLNLPPPAVDRMTDKQTRLKSLPYCSCTLLAHCNKLAICHSGF